MFLIFFCCGYFSKSSCVWTIGDLISVSKSLLVPGFFFPIWLKYSPTKFTENIKVATTRLHQNSKECVGLGEFLSDVRRHLRSQRGYEILRAGLRGGGELSHVAPGNCTQVLWKSIKGSSWLAHLSSPDLPLHHLQYSAQHHLSRKLSSAMLSEYSLLQPLVKWWISSDLPSSICLCTQLSTQYNMPMFTLSEYVVSIASYVPPKSSFFL